MAARLESLAEADVPHISGTVYDQVKTKLGPPLTASALCVAAPWHTFSWGPMNFFTDIDVSM